MHIFPQLVKSMHNFSPIDLSLQIAKKTWKKARKILPAARTPYTNVLNNDYLPAVFRIRIIWLDPLQETLFWFLEAKKNCDN